MLGKDKKKTTPPQSLSWCTDPPAFVRTALVRNKKPVVEGPSTGHIAFNVLAAQTAGTLKCCKVTTGLRLFGYEP